MPVLRSVFLGLSRSRSLRNFCERSSAGQRLSTRFVAGTGIEDAITVTQTLNSQGIAVTLDSLGESVTSEVEAHRAADVYHRLLDWIASSKAKAHISVKLTQMGLNLSPDLAQSIAEELVRHAREAGSFMRIDMEDSRQTQITLDIARRLHAIADLRGYVGVVIQACLYRSEGDIDQLIVEGIPVRLCKGAYKEPAEIAFLRKTDVDKNYLRLASKLIKSRCHPAFATHDRAIVKALKRHAKDSRIYRGRFEFQMPYGIRRDLQRSLGARGYPMRVCVPFGPDWYAYLMRRLAERPANAMFLARNIFRA